MEIPFDQIPLVLRSLSTKATTKATSVDEGEEDESVTMLQRVKEYRWWTDYFKSYWLQIISTVHAKSPAQSVIQMIGTGQCGQNNVVVTF